MSAIIPIDAIQQKIYLIRGRKVMLDKNLSMLYGVKPIRLREQVKRNKKRFPEDFMFQLNEREINLMVSQNAIASRKHLGGHAPYVFTEQGVAMLATVLNSDRAIQANIEIMRAFVKLRAFIASHRNLANKLMTIEMRINRQDEKIGSIFETLNRLMTPPAKKRSRIGFKRDKE